MTKAAAKSLEEVHVARMAFDENLSLKKLGRRPTLFEMRVYNAICAIPCGKVTTYGDLAKALHTSSRAIGQALRRNPFAPEVPCHRIVKADLSIGGFSGTQAYVGGYPRAFVMQGATPEVTKKINLLRKEGLRFAERNIADKSLVLTYAELQKNMLSTS